MGYESRFYVVEKSSQILRGEKLSFASIIAIFNMGKMGYDNETARLVKKSEPTDCYIYADDGDTMITKDKYGEPLKEVGIDNLILALSKDDDGYRRIMPFLQFLININASIEKWRHLAILHYGH